MRKLSYLTLILALATPFLAMAPSAHAQSCSCPWEVTQVNTTQSPGSAADCPMMDHNNQQNAGFWAANRCSGRGGACTYTYSSLSCTENSDGATASGLVNYKCNQC